MPNSKHTTDSAVLNFLEGAGTGDDRLDAVLAAMAEMPPAPERPDDLIARLAATAGHSAATPSASHPKPLPPRWRRRAVLSTILSSVAGKIAIASVALATTTAGLAAADSLPAQAQQVVSDIAARVGISLPAPESASTADLLDETDERIAPELPDEASDTAKRVIELIFGGDPSSEGAEFGGKVADSASDGKSQDSNGPEGLPGGTPDQIPAGPPSDKGGGAPASPGSPRP